MNSPNLPWIFAVEDSETDMYLLERVLKHGPDVPCIRRARDGEEALEALRRLAHEGPESLPNLVVIDLNLPRVDGYEVLNYLRRQEIFKAIPVVVITSSQAKVDQRRALADGADGYFVKTLDIASYGRFPDVIDEAKKARSEKLTSAPT